TQQLETSTVLKKSRCEGRSCAKCHKCLDWHFSGDQNTWDWLCNWEKWQDTDWHRWYKERSKMFTKRNDAICVFHLGGARYSHSCYAASRRASCFEHLCLCERH
ncbi:unnamed protein product, partial [Rotaria sp. Silwood2]